MRFHTDHYFAIGAAHLSSGKPCQDHALSSTDKKFAGAVIADGCSSGGHTDVGARILTLSTLEAMRGTNTSSIEAVAMHQQHILRSARALFNLRKSDMLATCAYAVATLDEGAVIHVQGDGATAIKYKDGAVEMAHYEWESNTPYYPAYSANDEESDFFAHHGARFVLANPTLHPQELIAPSQEFIRAGVDRSNPLFYAVVLAGKNSPALTVETLTLHKNSKETGISYGAKQQFTAESGVSGHVLRLDPEALSRVQLIAVFSDGVSQVEGMEWHQVVSDLLAMKNVNGEFVKRRSIRGLRDMRDRGKGPQDDVSVAMICVED